MEPRKFLNMIFFDVASACNLSCPFCVFDWRTLKKGTLATPAVLQKVYSLAPHVHDGHLSLSCAHEPTMHPELAAILNELPNEYRSKFFMTTNMANKMSDELISAIAQCGISHVNISVDTLDENKFRFLRRGGNLSAFLANMDRLLKAVNKSDQGRTPQFRFITMGFKSNIDEIMPIIEYGEKCGVVTHEIRYLFDVDHVSDEFKSKHVLDDTQWNWLARETQDKAHVIVYAPPMGYKYKFQADEGYVAREGANSLATATVLTVGQDDLNYEPPPDEDFYFLESGGPKKSKDYIFKQYNVPRTVNGTVPPFSPIDKPPTLHISSDGSAVISEWGKERFEINLLSLRDPAQFFDAIVH